MSYIFIGRYSKTLFVDVITFNDKETALDYYQKTLLENEQGYNEIELLEQTATHFYNIIEKNMI